MMYKRYVKRILDIFFSGVLLVILSPLFLYISVWIKKDSKGPVFFRQIRIGKNHIRFKMFKFRSMFSDTPSEIPTALLEKPESYITKSGVFLRKTSLDELPQLINIFKGDMSFVGPRPALWNQDDLIELRQSSGVNDFIPGLTGLAQVNGRDELPIPLKVEYDTEYARNNTFINDLKILQKTITNVILQKGIKEGRW